MSDNNCPFSGRSFEDLGSFDTTLDLAERAGMDVEAELLAAHAAAEAAAEESTVRANERERIAQRNRYVLDRKRDLSASHEPATEADFTAILAGDNDCIARASVDFAVRAAEIAYLNNLSEYLRAKALPESAIAVLWADYQMLAASAKLYGWITVKAGLQRRAAAAALVSLEGVAAMTTAGRTHQLMVETLSKYAEAARAYAAWSDAANRYQVSRG